MSTPINPATVAVTPQDAARGRKRAQRMYPLTTCETCGTTRQLSRDHRDRNPLNNSPENVAILCLSCHTTKEWRTGAYAERRPPILVRGARGRIIGTLPQSSSRSTRSAADPTTTKRRPATSSPIARPPRRTTPTTGSGGSRPA